ncbi:MAG: response regulator transcription factor [Acutalibacteraceae bacterium]|nr:response regulator transcription factor [Oscillospiraceae bacterium]
MSKKTVLVVEDDNKLRNTVSDYLEINNFSVIAAESGEKALEIFENQAAAVDIVLLDVMLPSIDGFGVLRKIREKSSVPVIIISARESEEDQLRGFRLGADNYLTKPFLLSVMKEHINSILSRVKPREETVIRAGDLIIDKASRKVTAGGNEIEMTPKEFDVIAFFAENEGTVFSRDTILDEIWGVNYYGDFRTVDTIIKQLRKKLSDKYPYIKSVYGIGYKFEIAQ